MLVTLGLLGVAAGAAILRPHQTSPAGAARSFEPLARAPAERPRLTERPARIAVYVAGEVVRPGVYDLPPGSRTEAAVRAAGGMRSTADAVAINLAARVEDGEEIAVPARGEAGEVVRARSVRGRRGAGRGRHRRRHGSAQRASRKDPGEPVDLNTADAVTLETLPGVGPALAERIVEFREANGPFASLDDVLDVAGTSPRLVEELAPDVLVGGR